MDDEFVKFGSLDSELILNSVRSSGPGGQNVNKVNSKVELRFDVLNSSILSAQQRMILLDKLRAKISDDGILIITCQVSRSQLENKELVLSKFYILINKSLKPVKTRIATKPTKASKEKRLEDKRVVAKKKERRRELY